MILHDDGFPEVVSVGLPVYNGQRFLPQALDSLLAQTFGHFILIICDNASTDGTEEICRNYASRDRRIRYYRNARNIGLSANFNRVFSFARTRYFKWATADDFVSADLLFEAVAVLDSDPSIVLCYPSVMLLDEISGGVQPYDDPLKLMGEDPVERFVTLLTTGRLSHHHQGLIRTAAIRRTGMLRDYVGSDVDFLAELTLYGKFHEMPQAQLFRRVHPESSSWNRASAAHQARRYHAAGVSRVALSSWRKHLSLLRAVLRSPCTRSQKAKLVTYLSRSMYWNKTELVGEIIQEGLRGVGRRRQDLVGRE